MDNSVTVGAAHYILEKNQAEACPKDPITSLNYDPRWYQAGGLSITEKNFLTEN